jgi:hypothetical protein
VTEAQRSAFARKAVIALVLCCISTWAMMGRSTPDSLGPVGTPQAGAGSTAYSVETPGGDSRIPAQLRPINPDAARASMKPVAPRDRVLLQPSPTPAR